MPARGVRVILYFTAKREPRQRNIVFKGKATTSSCHLCSKSGHAARQCKCREAEEEAEVERKGGLTGDCHHGGGAGTGPTRVSAKRSRTMEHRKSFAVTTAVKRLTTDLSAKRRGTTKKLLYCGCQAGNKLGKASGPIALEALMDCHIGSAGSGAASWSSRDECLAGVGIRILRETTPTWLRTGLAITGTIMESTDGPFVGSKVMAQLELLVKQSDGIKTVTLKKVALVPDLGQNVLSAKQTSRSSGNKIRICHIKVFLVSGDNACRFHSRGSGPYVMEIRNLREHPHEQVTMKTAKATSTTRTGERSSCTRCSKVKARCHAVPKLTENMGDGEA